MHVHLISVSHTTIIADAFPVQTKLVTHACMQCQSHSVATLCYCSSLCKHGLQLWQTFYRQRYERELVNTSIPLCKEAFPMRTCLPRSQSAIFRLRGLHAGHTVSITVVIETRFPVDVRLLKPESVSGWFRYQMLFMSMQWRNKRSMKPGASASW